MGDCKHNLNSEADIREKVSTWLNGLQNDKKFSFTNSLNKYSSSATLSEQIFIIELIYSEMQTKLENDFKCKDLESFQKACNVVNGCYGTFTHATVAISLCFTQNLLFLKNLLCFCIELLGENKQTSSVKRETFELTHTASRLLVLTIKLKRRRIEFQSPQCCNNSSWEEVINNITSRYKQFMITQEDRLLLSQINCLIPSIFLYEDVPVDTLYNIASTSLIIRELLFTKEALMKFHDEVVQELAEDNVKTKRTISLMRLLLCNAVINTWTSDIISVKSVGSHLHFLLSVGERYSSDTPIALSSCRTLTTLVKHESFVKYIQQTEDVNMNEHLFSCCLMFLEHPVSCIRHSAKDILDSLVKIKELQRQLLASALSLPRHKRSFFILISYLAAELGTCRLLTECPGLPDELLKSLYDPTIVSHVSVALESVMLNHDVNNGNIDNWCETWIYPVLVRVTNALAVVAADIEKLLFKIIKERPFIVDCVLSKWQNTSEESELRSILTCLKIGCKLGYKSNKICVESVVDNTALWRDLIPTKLLYSCLYHFDDEIRLSAFSLLIENHKSTELYSRLDFQLIKCFIKYNLVCQKPAVRQRIVGLIKKMLQRWLDSLSVVKRKLEHSQEKEQDRWLEEKNSYFNFYIWLINFSYENIYPSANSCRMSTVLSILLSCYELRNNSKVQHKCFDELFNVKHWEKIIVCLSNSYEDNKIIGFKLASGFDSRQLGFDVSAMLAFTRDFGEQFM